MRGTSQREKIQTFDQVKDERDKLALAVCDLVNGKFSKAVRIPIRDYDKSWESGWYSIRLSLRAMPLFICEQHLGGTGVNRVDVYTDNEIQDLYRDKQYLAHARMLMNGRLQLMAKYMPAESPNSDTEVRP
jgi:hypothetical protein